MKLMKRRRRVVTVRVPLVDHKRCTAAHLDDTDSEFGSFVGRRTAGLMLTGRLLAIVTFARISILLILVTACNFPRPADVGDDEAACCVTAVECARVGYDTPHPCPLGVCVNNECASTSGSCDGDEDCGAGATVCVDNACAVCRTSASCPASAPVCDETTHDCRSCARDRECDSGACDLAAGTCVDPREILYASPGGTQDDPCTRNLPCLFSKTASVIDSAHRYIVLRPGIHAAGAHFDGKNVTVCGNGATIDAGITEIVLSNGASVRMRDFTIIDGSALGIAGIRYAISTSGSDLTLDNIDLHIRNLIAFPTITIRNSIITKGSIDVLGRVVIDRSTLSNSTIITRDTGESLEITNSLFVSMPGQNAISIRDGADPNAQGRSWIANNTFIGGAVACAGRELNYKSFESNIFYNVSSLQGTPGCYYGANLITPLLNVPGRDNFTGDPLFVDAARGDFHLLAQSPAIGAASLTRPNGHDHDGTLRPQGGRSDVGAFEYVP